MTAELRASYARCRQVVQRSGSHFVWSFCLLPRAQRQGMQALYAFARHTDDLGDQGELAARASRLADWKTKFSAALEGDCRDPILLAVVDAIRRFSIPVEFFAEIIAGVERDVQGFRPRDFAELEGYCYQVASVVGLACIHIWGFDGPKALSPAHDCGIAFQLTNILRDLKADMAEGRCYLPADELAAADCTPEDLGSAVMTEPLRELMRTQLRRAESYYQRAAELHRYLSRPGRRIFSAMFGTYRRLLDEIIHRDGDVWSRRVRLSRGQKLWAVGRALCTSGPSPEVRT